MSHSEPFPIVEQVTSDRLFGWGDNRDVKGEKLRYTLAVYADVTGLGIEFPRGERYEFNLIVYDMDDEPEDGITKKVRSEFGSTGHRISLCP